MIDESLTLKVMTDVPIGMKLSLENLTPYALNFPRCIALRSSRFFPGSPAWRRCWWTARRFVSCKCC